MPSAGGEAKKKMPEIRRTRARDRPSRTRSGTRNCVTKGTRRTNLPDRQPRCWSVTQEGVEKGRPITVLRRLVGDRSARQGEAGRDQGPVVDVEERTGQGATRPLIPQGARPRVLR